MTSVPPYVMPVSLLSLPYELREQILVPLLCKRGSIKLQHTTDSKSEFTPPISQVCRLLRDEAVRVFYKVNTFTLTIDPEAVSSNVTLYRWASDSTCANTNVPERTLRSFPLPCKRCGERSWTRLS